MPLSYFTYRFRAYSTPSILCLTYGTPDTLVLLYRRVTGLYYFFYTLPNVPYIIHFYIALFTGCALRLHVTSPILCLTYDTPYALILHC